jgi:hypothetical protein
MKRTIMASVIIAVLMVWSVPFANSAMANEGTGSTTSMYSGTFNVVPIDENHFVMIYDNKGVTVSDSREGPFNNMSLYNVGSIYFENGVGKLLGYVTMTDPEGDKVLVEIREDGAKLAPAVNSGAGKYIYGTGKFKGIQGTMEYKRWYVRPATKDSYQAISKSQSSWKIVP